MAFYVPPTVGMPTDTKGHADRADQLIEELKAIEYWDANCWRTKLPRGYEMTALHARQRRRTEILQQLLNVAGATGEWNEPMGDEEIEKNERTEPRRYPRFKLNNEVRIRSAKGFVPGRTVEISESGMSAVLPDELQIGEIVELSIRSAIGVATTRAVVKNRNVFRHGFEFLQPLHDVLAHDATPEDCQRCTGTGFIMQTVDGGQGVAFVRNRCTNCSGSGRTR